MESFVDRLKHMNGIFKAIGSLLKDFKHQSKMVSFAL